MLNNNYLKQLAARNKKLNKAGFKNYSEFLTSDLWQQIRKEFITWSKKRKNWLCHCCGNTRRLQIHHLRYGKITKSTKISFNLMVPVCSRCHKEISELCYREGIIIRTATRKIRKKYS